MAVGPLRKVVYLLGAVLAVLVLVGAPGLGQQVIEPSGEISDAECYGHHKEAGFRSMDLFPEVVTEVPAGQLFTFHLTIRNPWLHELQDVRGYVNISGAPSLSFPGEKDPLIGDRIQGSFPRSPTQTAQSAPLKIPVEANATEMIVAMTGTKGSVRDVPRLPGLENDYGLRVSSPDGSTVLVERVPQGDPGAATASEHVFKINYDNLTAGGTGEWTATVLYRGAEEGAYTLDHSVYYNLSRSSEIRVPAPNPRLMPGETTIVEFTILADNVQALQQMRYGGLAHAYHDHSDRNTEDDGNYDKWNTIQFATGAELKVGAAQVTATSIDTLSPIFRRWGEVLGFAGSFLIIPSLVFGGTFGRGSVDLFNKMFGSPRRRVLFHNSLSFWLLGTSVLHMILLFYEAQFGWSKGLVWGGLALACMIGLGITGATQRSFVAQWGFTRWRFIHFAMGILVFVFVLIHMVADGTHLAPIRDMFG